MTASSKPSPKLVTITREEFRPSRGGLANYAGNWRYLYSFEGLKKPLNRLPFAVKLAKSMYPGAKIVCAWKDGAS